MARGGDDSDEERHDRFRSERNSITAKRLFPGGSKRSNLNSSLGDDRRRDRRRSRDRSQSRNRRDRSPGRRDRISPSRRDRSPDVRKRDVEDRRPHKRRSYSPDREEQPKKIREGSRSHSYDKYKNKHRSRGSSERRSDSHSSHDSRTDRKRSKHSKRNRDEEVRKSAHQVDTFMNRFERRRSSSVEEEVVDNNIVYRDTSQSPERTKHKKKKNGEREKRKDKKKDKKKKKKSDSLEKDSRSLLPPGDVEFEDVDSAEDRLSPEISSPKTENVPDVYGPRMPPVKPTPSVPSSSPEASLPGNRSSLADSSKNQEKEDIYGPVAPPSSKKSSTEESDAGSGVAAPEAAPQKDSSRVYGPVLPQREAVVVLDDEDSSYGPALPPRLTHQAKPAPSAEDDSDDGGDYGPLPAGLGGRTEEELEMRAALIKRQLKNQEESESRPKKREEWMLELPASKRADLGLGPRKFRAREAPDMSDRSSWTDTPEEKKRKEEMSKLGIDVAENDDDNTNSRRLGIIQRDKEMEKKAREGKKKDKSLLDMHQKELKKKKKKEEKERAGKKEERRPFSRETDLQTNRFDEAQKRSIIKKAQLLDTRFSRGESKFL